MVAQMQTTGLIAIIRAPGKKDGSADVQSLVDLCKALRDGGVLFTEITMTTPGALEAIRQARVVLRDDAVLGVGSVLDGESAHAAITAGAQFVVSPITSMAVIEMCHRYDVAVIPGALTPTEIMTAFQAGADMVKVFPAKDLGPGYIKDILAPMPQLKLVPTGGVDLKTIPDWLAAGVACLGVGTALCKKELIEARDWKAITDLARQFVQAVERARG